MFFYQRDLELKSGVWQLGPSRVNSFKVRNINNSTDIYMPDLTEYFVILPSEAIIPSHRSKTQFRMKMLRVFTRIILVEVSNLSLNGFFLRNTKESVSKVHVAAVHRCEMILIGSRIG